MYVQHLSNTQRDPDPNNNSSVRKQYRKRIMEYLICRCSLAIKDLSLGLGPLCLLSERLHDLRATERAAPGHGAILEGLPAALRRLALRQEARGPREVVLLGPLPGGASSPGAGGPDAGRDAGRPGAAESARRTRTARQGPAAADPARSRAPRAMAHADLVRAKLNKTE